VVSSRASERQKDEQFQLEKQRLDMERGHTEDEQRDMEKERKTRQEKHLLALIIDLNTAGMQMETYY